MEIKANKNKPMRGIIPQDITYHRNGVGGQPFVSMKYGWHDNDMESTLENRFPMRIKIATIAFNSDHQYDDTTCRVIDVDYPHENWRGDRLAFDIIAVLRHYAPELED